MATINQAVGKLSESESLYKEGPEGQRTVVRDPSIGRLVSVSIVWGCSTSNKGDSEEAGATCREPYRFSKLPAGATARTATHWRIPGLVTPSAKLAESRKLLVRALAILERDSGETNVGSIALMETLADLSLRNGDHAEASKLYRRVLEGKRAQFGDSDVELLVPLNALGSIHHSRGDYRSAQGYFRQALEIAEKTLGDQDPDTAVFLINLATSQAMRKQFTSAEPLYQRALAIWEKSLPSGDPRLRLGIENLAILYTRQGKHAQASVLYERLRGMQASSSTVAEKSRSALYTVELTDLLRQTSGTKGFRRYPSLRIGVCSTTNGSACVKRSLLC